MPGHSAVDLRGGCNRPTNDLVVDFGSLAIPDGDAYDDCVNCSTIGGQYTLTLDATTPSADEEYEIRWQYNDPSFETCDRGYGTQTYSLTIDMLMEWLCVPGAGFQRLNYQLSLKVRGIYIPPHYANDYYEWTTYSIACERDWWRDADGSGIITVPWYGESRSLILCGSPSSPPSAQIWLDTP